MLGFFVHIIYICVCVCECVCVCMCVRVCVSIENFNFVRKENFSPFILPSLFYMKLIKKVIGDLSAPCRWPHLYFTSSVIAANKDHCHTTKSSSTSLVSTSHHYQSPHCHLYCPLCFHLILPLSLPCTVVVST